MKGSVYHKQMKALGEELERAASAEPYDDDAYNDVTNRINNLNHLWYVSLRHRPWIINFVIICCILFIAYLVYLLLSEL